MTPRRARIAYQCWWLINSTAGECTLSDMAEFTGATATECGLVCSRKGWGTLYRKTMLDTSMTRDWRRGNDAAIRAFDHSLDDVAGVVA